MQVQKSIAFYNQQEVQAVEHLIDVVRAVHGQDLRQGQAVVESILCEHPAHRVVLEDVVGRVKKDVPGADDSTALAIAAGAYLGHSPQDIRRMEQQWTE